MTYAHEIKCEVCGVDSSERALFRNGPKGQKAPWRCIAHVDPEYHPDGGVLEITDAIEAHTRAAGGGG